MDEDDRARELQEQVGKTGQLSELGYGRRPGDWPERLTEPCEPTQDELDFLQSHVPGHRWDGWRRLTGDEDYYAACSCGWRNTEIGRWASLSPSGPAREEARRVWHCRGTAGHVGCGCVAGARAVWRMVTVIGAEGREPGRGAA